MKTFTHYTKEEKFFLRKNYPKEGAFFCAKELKRSPRSIRVKAYSLGLKIDPEFSTERIRINRLINGKFQSVYGWKRRIKFFANYTCADCGLKDPIIMDAHHTDPKDRFNLKKGLCLCPNCHRRRTLQEKWKFARRLTKGDKEIIKDLKLKNYSLEKISNLTGIGKRAISKA